MKCSKKMCITLLLGILVVIMTSSTVCALDLSLLLQIDAAEAGKYDFAITEAAAHVAYVKQGQVYYATITASNLTWQITSLGAGDWPSIAGNRAGDVSLVYSNAGNIYEASNFNAWTPTVIGQGTKPSISSNYFGPGFHLLVEGNYDSDGYTEIVHSFNAGSGWSPFETLLDGWYDSGSGNYYGQSSIAVLMDGSYAIAYEFQNWGGRASWSNKEAVASGSSIGSTSVSTGWNNSIVLSRRAIASVSDENPMAAYGCSIDGQIYAAFYDGTQWQWLSGLGTGGAPSISWGGAAFTGSDGNMRFVRVDEGQVYLENITYGGANLAGSDPIIWAIPEGDVFVLFRDGQGNLQFGISTIPEPNTLAPMFFGLLGAGGFLLRRMKTRK